MIKCCGLIRPHKIWHLHNKNGFFNRRMESCTCPICENFVVQLFETRFTDNREFIEIRKKNKAHKLYNQCKKELDYEQKPIKYGTKAKMGFRFGENVENNNCIKQIAVDFNGSKFLTKSILT